MRIKNPVDIIENFRRGQQRRFPFTGTDVLMALLILAFLLLAGYLTFIAKPELPAFLKLNTLTPTVACECAVTAPNNTATPTSQSANILPAASATAQPTQADTATAAPSATSTQTAPSATATTTPTASLTPTATETATATLTPSATLPTTFVYTVQTGDTLSTIADRYGFTVAEVMAVNPDLKDPSFIYIGQKIFIPRK